MRGAVNLKLFIWIRRKRRSSERMKRQTPLKPGSLYGAKRQRPLMPFSGKSRSREIGMNGQLLPAVRWELVG